MRDIHGDHSAEPWPDSYEAPTLEPLGSVWDRTGGGVGFGGDTLVLVTE